jgi:hypothetical protein
MPARNLLTSADAWRIVTDDPFESHGGVNFSVNKLSLAMGKPGTGVNYRGPVPRMNYSISVEAMRTEGEDFFYGLTFPINDQHASLIIGGWGGGVTGISNMGGMSAVENETTGYTPFENDRWYKIKLSVSKKAIRVLLDEREIIQVETAKHQYSVWPQQATMCPLGIATWKTASEIRNLVLQEP